MIRSFAFCLLLLLLAPACETVVVLDIPQKDNLLVLNGLVIADQQTVVRVNRSWPVFEDAVEEESFLPGATVSLYEDDVYVGPLVETPGGVYTYDFSFDTLFRPKELRRYRVEASHPDFPSASATTLLPPSSVPLEPWIGDTVQLGGKDHLELFLDLEDPGDRTDFYSFEVFVESMFFAGPICFRNTEEAFEGTSDFFPDIGTLPQYCGKVYLTDAEFNGQTKRITFLLPLTQFEDPTFLPGTVLRVVVGLYSEELYRYNLTAQLQADNEGNPFSQPVVVEDNVEGGFGLIGGYSADAAVAVIP